MAGVDGQIILGLNINATTANIQAGLDSILNNAKVRKIVLQTAIEKTETERSIDALVKSVNKRTAKIGVQVDAKDVNSILTQQQKIASTQTELNRKMQEYRSLAKEIGITLNKDTWNAFNQAIKTENFDKAREIIKSAKKQIDDYNRAVQSMNKDTSVSGSVSSIIDRFSQLKNVSSDVQKKISLLKANFAQFEQADSTKTKLSAYRRLQTTIEQLNTEYRNLQQTEKAASGDSSIQNKIKDAQTLYNAYSKIYSTADGNAGGALKQSLAELNEAILNFNKNSNGLSGGKLAAEWEKVHAAIQNVTRSVKEYNAEQSVVGKLGTGLDASLQKINTAIFDVSNSGASGVGVDSLLGKLTELKTRAEDLKGNLSDLDPSNGEDVKNLKSQIEQLNTEFSKLGKDVKVFGNINDFSRFQSSVEKARQKVAEFADTYSAVKSNKALMSELKQLQDAAEGISSPEGLRQFNAQFDQFNTKVIQAGLNTKSFGDKLSTAFKNFGSFFSVSRMIYTAMSTIKQMVENVKELDSAMVELRKVTDATDAEFNSFLQRAKSNAVELGSTVTDLVNATADFSRLGYSLKDAENLAQVATIYKNVGDDINSIDDASNILITAMKAFNIEASDSVSIIDKLNEIGNNFAISSGDLGEGLTRAASYMATAGNSIDETLAMITAMTEITQDASESGNALKILAMRLRGAETELVEAGESTDGMAESTSKLREKILALTNVTGKGGFDIMLNEDEFKSTYEIMKGLSEVWDKMTNVNQAALIELIAGKQRGNSITALLTSMAQAEKILTSSIESSGSAMKEQEIWLDSIEAKTNQFKAAFEALSSTVVNSDLVKGLLDGAKSAIEWLDKLIQKCGGLGNTVTLLAAALTLLNLKKTSGMFASLFSSITNGFGIVSKAKGLFGDLRAAWQLGSEAGGGFITTLKGAASALVGTASSAAIATAAITGIVAVIAIAVAAYQNYKQKIEEQRQAAEEAATAYQEQSASVDEYKNTIRSLRDELDNGNLSEQEAYEKRQQLLQIEQELIDLFGDEAEGINLVTGSIESQISAIDKLSEAQWNAYKQENIDAIKRAVDLFTNFDPSKVDFWNSDIFGRITIDLPDTNSLWNGIKDLDLDIVPKDFKDDFTRRVESVIKDLDLPNILGDNFAWDAEGKTIYEILDVYQQLYDITEKMGKEYFGENYLDYVGDLLSEYSSQINSIKSTLEENETIFNTYVEGLLNYDQTYSEVWGKVLSAQKEYNDAVLNGDDDAAMAAFQKMKDAQQAFLDAGWDNDAVNLYMQDFFDKWNADAKNHELQLEIKTKLADDKDSLGNMVKQAAKHFEDEAGKVDLYAVLNAGVEYEKSPRKNNRHASLNEEEQAYVQLKYAAEQYGMTVEELITLLGQLGYITLSGTENVVETTKKAQKSYESLKTSVENVVDSQMAMKSVFADNTHLTEDTYNAIVALVGGEDKLADCIDTTNGYLVTNADALRKVVNAAEEATLSDLKMAEAHEKLNYHELVGQLYDVTDGLESYDEATLNSIGTILDQIDATKLQIAQYKLLEQQLLGVTNAFTELENAQAIDSAADYTDDLVSMIQTLIGSYENKEFGTEAFWTGLKSLVPEDIYGQFEDAGDQIEAGWEYLNDKLARYFTYDEGNVSIDSSNIEKFVSDALSTQLGDSTVFTGSLEHFELNPQIQSLEDLADAMGITTTAAFALASGISKYSANNADFLSSLTSDGTTIENLDNNIYQCDQTMQELLERRAQLAQAGEINTDEWDEVQDKISETKEQYESFRAEARKQIQASIQIDSQVTEQQELVDGLKTDLDNFDGTNAKYQVLLSNYTEEQQKLAELLQQKYQLGEPTEVTIQVALEQVQSEIDNTKAEIAKIADYDGETYTIKAGADQSDLDALLEKLDGLESEAAEIKVYAGLDDTDVLNSLESIQNYVIDDKNFKVEMNDGTTLSRLQQIKSTLTGIKDKTIHVRTYQTTYTSAVSGGRGGTSRATGSAHERGNWGIPRDEHDALVGELGEELVVDPRTGTYKTVGENGAELIDLPKGAIVFNHQQTKELLKNKKIHTRGEAYAEGNAHAGFGFVGRDYSFGESSKPSGSSGSVNANVTVSVDNKALEESLKDTLDEMKKNFDDIIGNFEHQIFLMEKNGASDAEIVQVYKKMQEEVHRQAEEYRKLGLDENSDYIQNLQKQWWEFADSIKDQIINYYDTLVKTNENSITLMQNWLDNAVAGNDYESVRRYTAEIVDCYKQMQEAIHEQAEFYRSMGYSDTSDEVSKLSDLWWDYQQNILNTTTDTFAKLVDNASDAVDEIQNVYDTLKNAAKEYSENGFITVDTLQDIIGLGTQYLAFLQDENGQLVINEQNIQKVIAARTQQLAVEQALSYIEQLRTALSNNDAIALQNLLTATDAATSSTWGLVYAQLAALNLDSNQYQAALQRINTLRSLTDLAVTSIGQTTGKITEGLQETSDALDDILDYVIDMIKQEVNNQIDALEDQIDRYKEIVDLKKESLQLAKEEDEYNKDVSDKLKDISKLQARIQQLSLDDIREAQAEKAKLEEELAEKQADLADKQSDYAYDATVDSLDKQADAFEKEKQQEIAILQDSISSYEKLYQMAINRINNHWDTLYNDLINWNTQYGSDTNEKLTAAWNNASAAVQQYGSYLAAVAATQSALNAASSSIGGGSTIGSMGDYSSDEAYGQQVGSIVKQMKANSAAWHNADAAKRKQLDQANAALAAQLSQILGRTVVRDDKAGVWYLDRIGGTKLYDMYHKGGIVGEPAKLKDNETIAVLEKGEMVLDEQKKQGLYRIVDAKETFGKAFEVCNLLNGQALGNHISQNQQDNIRRENAQAMDRISDKAIVISPQIDASVTIQGNVDKSAWDRVYSDMKRHSSEVAQIVNAETMRTFNIRGIKK